MDEENVQHEVHQEKKEITDAELLDKAAIFIKRQRNRLDQKLDLLHISFGMRILLLVLLLLNFYLVSIYTSLIRPIAILFPIIVLPFYLYGLFILPGIMLLNSIVSVLFIMRYRQHRGIFYFSSAIFLVSLGMVLLTLPYLISYIVALQQFN
jgi:hypothetical protein